MSDEKDERSGESEQAAAGSSALMNPIISADERDASGSAEGADRDSDPPRKERVDEDGLPLDREATIDDVRSTSGVHGRYALGCTIVIVVVILAFWLIRAGVGG